jgi:hypothetical protein
LSWDIVDAMSVVKELTPSPDGTVAEPPAAALDEVPALDEDAGADAVDDEEEDEQPAATVTAAAATATQPNRGRDLKGPWPCEREGRPPRPLLPSSIPYPFRTMRSDTPTRDTVQHACPSGMKGRSWER